MKKHHYNLRKTICGRSAMLMTILVLSGFSLAAQSTDSIPKPVKKLNNTIKLNLTSGILYNNSIQIGYERIIKKNQSINVYVGYNEFPVNLNLDALNSFSFTGKSKRSGYFLGFDYRFYLAGENKHDAPRGIYLAPFMNYYRFATDRTLTYTDSTGGKQSTNLHSNVDFFSVGGVLGYQFVLWKRLTIDLVLLGPSLTHYHFSARLDGKIQGIDEGETLHNLIEAMKDKFPLLKDLSKGQEVNRSGTEKFWSVGFRYSISIGFRF